MLAQRTSSMLATIARPLDLTATGLVLLMMASITIMIVVQVISRYFFSVSFALGWEIPRLSFITMVFLSIPLAYRQGKHVGIGVLISLLPPKLQSTIVRFCCLVVIAFLGVLLLLAYSMAKSTWHQYLPTLPIPVGIFYVSIMVSSVHLMLHVGRSLVLGTFDPLDDAGGVDYD